MNIQSTFGAVISSIRKHQVLFLVSAVAAGFTAGKELVSFGYRYHVYLLCISASLESLRVPNPRVLSQAVCSLAVH